MAVAPGAVDEVIQWTIGGEVAVECCTELSARACVTCWTSSRIQASAGLVTDKALEEIIFRAAPGVMESFTPYASRAAGCDAAECCAHAVDDIP